jgi:AcrR family transcriptional regulator
MAIDRQAAFSTERRQTREGLLKTAKALFLLKGLAAVTVDDICLAADVSKGGLYHHFPGKESMFLMVALEELRRELGLSVHPASDTPAGRGTSALLVNLWAWAPRRPQACRRVRAVHRQAVRRLSKVPGQAACATPSPGDSEARAALALLIDMGRVVEAAMARYLATSEREPKQAVAG